MDYCYQQNEDNDIIFLREVKPLISGLFDGFNATVIAYGARGSGKTSVIKVKFNSLIFVYTVKSTKSFIFLGINCFTNELNHWAWKGIAEKPGLAEMAMDEILSVAEKNGNSVAISLYEVYQDRVSDLLDIKQPAVFVLEDAQGKIQLKGLSRVSYLVFLFTN